MSRFYCDAAATTYVSSEVLTEMLPTFTTAFGNASSIHSYGMEASNIVEKARDRIKTAIKAEEYDSIVFTGSGTEANNLAILGYARKAAKEGKGRHIITTKIEHPSVLEACKQLEKEGFKVTYLPVDANGLVSIITLLDKLRNDTILISVILANNEVGTIQNISAISKIAHEKNIMVHTDGVAALGYVPIDVVNMGIDLMSFSAHKIYGPKGVGALYIREGVEIESQILGGHQEDGLRAGSLNVPAIAGFGKAAEIAARDLYFNNQKLKTIRDYFTKQVKEKIPHIKLNGHEHQRLANLVNLSFDLIEGEAILFSLADVGVSVSTGSACTSLSFEPSHVLMAMGVDKGLAQGSIRFSFLKNTQKEDVDNLVKDLEKIIKRLRELSPLKRSKI